VRGATVAGSGPGAGDVRDLTDDRPSGGEPVHDDPGAHDDPGIHDADDDAARHDGHDDARGDR
jgi:hypothetical protein